MAMKENEKLCRECLRVKDKKLFPTKSTNKHCTACNLKFKNRKILTPRQKEIKEKRAKDMYAGRGSYDIAKTAIDR